MKFRVYCTAVLLVLLQSACAPEVGSDAWCEDLKKKPKSEWTANEAGNFTRHCLLR